MGFEFDDKNNESKLSKFAQRLDEKLGATCPICDRGDKFMSKNQYKKAVNEYITSILCESTSLPPNKVRPYKAVSKAYKNLKAYDKAIKHLEKAKSFYQFDPEIYYELGLNHLLNANPDVAIKNFVRTIRLDKDNINAQLQLAISHELSGEANMALAIYQKIIEENPKFILAYNHKAGLFMQLEMYGEASMLFKHILKINPNYYRANLGLGICFDKLEKFPAAIRYYKKYIASKPKSDTSYALVNRICEIYSNNPTNKKSKQNLKIV